jgi:hypothetical protein
MTASTGKEITSLVHPTAMKRILSDTNHSLITSFHKKIEKICFPTDNTCTHKKKLGMPYCFVAWIYMRVYPNVSGLTDCLE